MLTIGTKTPMGKVVGVTFTGGDRYYFIMDKFGTVSLVPADTFAK